MMQEDASQPFYGSSGNTVRRYEPPQDFPTTSPSQAPDVDYYTATSVMGEHFILEQGSIGERVKNCPPCKPIVHHNINVDIAPEKRLFVRKAYVGWFFHCFCLVWNFCSIMGALIMGEVGILPFLYALAGVLLGPPISFGVYFLLYRGMRTYSAFFFGLWFAFYIGQLAAQLFFSIGLSSYGSAGFLLMVSCYSDSKLVLGVVATVSTFMWIGVFVYSLWIFYQARGEFKALGGAKAASKEFAKKGVQTAYDNRGYVKDVIVENKETIKQVALDNKDAIIDFAKEHRQEIAQVAMDNREVVTRVAMDNRDTIWENREVVASVFENPKN